MLSSRRHHGRNAQPPSLLPSPIPPSATWRTSYLAASSASAYSLVSMVSRFAPIMKEGGSIVSLTYMASEKVIPGYGGGMRYRGCMCACTYVCMCVCMCYVCECVRVCLR